MQIDPQVPDAVDAARFQETLTLFEGYDVTLVVLGVAFLAIAVVPRLTRDKPLSLPIVLLGVGILAFALPLGLEPPDPIERGDLTKRLTELGVIISLMGAGLKIDRPLGLRRWRSTWRLLAVTMPLTVVAVALLGWTVGALAAPAAILLGAVVSPTDPVLAGEVQVGMPGKGSGEGEDEDERAEGGEEREDAGGIGRENGDGKHGGEDEVRFALTSEAGLNDGLAFPYTNLAIAVAVAGLAPANWLVSWLVVDVAFKITVAVVVGILLGRLIARPLISLPAPTELGRALLGVGALAATLMVYGLTESLGGYGFIATFVAAVAIRSYERGHEHQERLHQFSEVAEHLVMAGVLLALGGAVVGGLLAPLTPGLVATAALVLLVARPLAGAAGMLRLHGIPWRDRWAISFFGIRGIGSLYYLAYALEQTDFPAEEEVWAVVGLIVIASVVMHGLLATPVTERLDRARGGA